MVFNAVKTRDFIFRCENDCDPFLLMIGIVKYPLIPFIIFVDSIKAIASDLRE